MMICVPAGEFFQPRLLVLVQGLSALLALLLRLGAPGFCSVLRLLGRVLLRHP